jgi:hypothetical protein
MQKAFLLVLVALVTLGITLLLLEWVYRAQLVDTYRPELYAFNPVQVFAQDDRPTLLVMGDSFTAGRASYAGILQDRVREWRVMNAAVSGTGVLQALYMAPNRFAQFRPSMFLYQVYVGNDLFDIRYPTNWHTISPARNAYWLLANHLRVVGYLNYRLRQVMDTLVSGRRGAPSLPVIAATPAAEPRPAFSVERYDARVKIHVRAEPSLVEDSILLQGRRQRDFAVFLGRLDRLLAYCQREMCRAYILVIPHVCQVDEAYLPYMRQLGARFTTPAAMRLAEYPFLAGLREHFASRSNVHILDPRGMLQEVHRHRAVYYANDEHLNPDGQRALAAWLVQQLNLH